jgi:hypothetical protein
MVVMNVGVNESSEKRNSKQLLPTPAAPRRQREHCTRAQKGAWCVRRGRTRVANQQQLDEVVVARAFARRHGAGPQHSRSPTGVRATGDKRAHSAQRDRRAPADVPTTRTVSTPPRPNPNMRPAPHLLLLLLLLLLL